MHWKTVMVERRFATDIGLALLLALPFLLPVQPGPRSHGSEIRTAAVQSGATFIHHNERVEIRS
jgi:hypothetical protein